MAPGDGPRILVFSTNNVSDPGIDLAGSSHLNYPVGVRVISVPCSSGIHPDWILHAFAAGFDGVFIAADGGDCSKIANCTERTAGIVGRAQEMMRAHGIDTGRLKMAGLCSVCAEPFVHHMRSFAADIEKLGAPARNLPRAAPSAG
ncbi:MAG: hydrogenase iron-sulfur subunit [Thermoplasmata archaeon]